MHVRVPLMGSLGVVALFNSNRDAIAVLRRLLESAGFDVVAAPIPDVCDGRCDVDAMMDRHDPAVVIYDIGSPYDQNWDVFQQLRARTSMRDRRFVITAADGVRVEQLAGADDRIYDIVEARADLSEIVQAVKEAERARIIRAEQPGSTVMATTERRFHRDRRAGWTPNDIYTKLREKREAVEFERRHAGRRTTSNDPNDNHAA